MVMEGNVIGLQLRILVCLRQERLHAHLGQGHLPIRRREPGAGQPGRWRMAHVSDQRRYRDYLPPGSMPAQPPTEDVRPAESAVVMRMSDGSWHAVWQGDTLLGEFDGTREEAVAWARSRSSR